MASKIICYNVATKIGPRTSRRCFKTRQYAPGCPKGRLKFPQDTPKRPQDAPKTPPKAPPRRSKKHPRRRKTHPRRPKTRQRRLDKRAAQTSPRLRIWVILATMLTDFPRILKDLGNEFGSMFGLISKCVLAELRFTDRPRRVREAKRILRNFPICFLTSKSIF